MKRRLLFWSFLILLCHTASAQFIQYHNTDPRCIRNGNAIPSENYADQPYIIVCDDGSWLCVLTTSSGTEGAHMNHIVASKSYDHGQSWSEPVNVEPAGPPQSSWAVPLKVPGGRIYVFYNYNKFGFKDLEGVMSGPFMFKYSDDNGITWSKKHYEVLIRKTKIDEDNYTKGKNQFFWSIAKPEVTGEAAYITFSKILRNSAGQSEFYNRSEGFILKSKNILNEINPDNIKWETLPEGDTGIWNPDLGLVQAEHNMVILNNGDLYVVYRTYIGSPAYSISHDGGKTFTKPRFMRYANGEGMGNPRACPKIYKTKEGKYLFWFHNNFRQHTYLGRNPAWLSGGIEDSGDIVWSQPEIALYDIDPELTGMSYPDFFEQDGRMWISETQKNVARVHEINFDLLRGMWDQYKDSVIVRKGLIADCDAHILNAGRINFPSLPDLSAGGGFSIDLWLKVDQWKENQMIFSTFGPKNKGIDIATAEDHNIKLRINDGDVREPKYGKGQTFFSDSGSLSPHVYHHVVFIVDGAAKVASIVVDGVLSDGSVTTRPYGWSWIYPYLGDLNDSHMGAIDTSFKGEINHIRIYNRYLHTSEAIANFNAGMK